jgi:hypothetical protein
MGAAVRHTTRMGAGVLIWFLLAIAVVVVGAIVIMRRR